MIEEAIDLYSLLRQHDWSLDMNEIARSASHAQSIDVEILVRMPAQTPMLDWAAALTALAEKLGGTWSYQAAPGSPRGRYEIEVIS